MRGRRLVVLLTSIVLVVALGAVAAWAELSNNQAVNRVHRADRVQEQATLSGLVTQYLQFTELATDNAATSNHFQLSADSASDRRALESVVHNSPLTSYGAVLTTLTGRSLTSYPASAARFPAASDPGYKPLRAALMAGKPGVSGVMRVGGVPLVAVAVPVEQGRFPAGLLIAYADIARWPLQGYTASLHLGSGSQTYVLDGAGTVVSASDSHLVGTTPHLPAAVSAGHTGLTTATLGGVATTVAYGPAASGWYAVTTQPVSSFSGALTAGHTREAVALIALLVLTVLLLAWFHHRRQQALAELADERLYDPLTGLALRRLLDIRLEAAIARQRRHGGHLTVVYGDLDGFKAVNDRHSHKVGDEVLRVVGQRLRDAVRDDDFVARLGGDEFVVILESDEVDDLDTVLRRMRRKVGQPLTAGKVTLTPWLSLGAAVLGGVDEVPDLVHEADLAMYDAKHTGIGQRVVRFEAGAGAQAAVDAHRPTGSTLSDTVLDSLDF